jgi:hypothetical protein
VINSPSLWHARITHSSSEANDCQSSDRSTTTTGPSGGPVAPVGSMRLGVVEALSSRNANGWKRLAFAVLAFLCHAFDIDLVDGESYGFVPRRLVMFARRFNRSAQRAEWTPASFPYVDDTQHVVTCPMAMPSAPAVFGGIVNQDSIVVSRHENRVSLVLLSCFATRAIVSADAYGTRATPTFAQSCNRSSPIPPT